VRLFQAIHGLQNFGKGIPATAHSSACSYRFRNPKRREQRKDKESPKWISGKTGITQSDITAVRTASVRVGLHRISKAKDGLREAHRDVLVAVL
jgi:hypothetical protein